MRIAAFGVRKPVVANLVMFAVIGAGLIFGSQLRREFFPYIEPRIVTITAPYPGAAPDEVESALAKKIEDRVSDLTAVKEMNTTVSEGLCMVMVEFEEGTSIDKAVSDVKREVDALQDLPPESDRIVVDKLEMNLPAIVMTLSGDASERSMKDFMRQTRDDLLTLPEITDVLLGGQRADELRVEVAPELALKHGISLTEISDRIASAMAELPGGSVRGDASTVSVRSVGVDERADEVRDIVIRAEADGSVIRVGDVALVTEGFVDNDLRVRFDGKPAISLTVFRVGEQDVIKISENVKAYVAGRRGESIKLSVGERLRLFAARMQADGVSKQRYEAAMAAWEAAGSPEGGRPAPGVGGEDPAAISDRYGAYALGYQRSQVSMPPGKLVTTTDLARFVQGRLDLLTRNAFQGGILVFVTLVLLLNWRISFWVAAGLVVSLLGTLAVMSWLGVTLNLLTMFGLIIVIGILVDDAIVVAENITTRHEKGEPALVAAVTGTGQVGWPVVSTVLTTIFAFLPLSLLNGQIGDFLGVLPIVVGCALAVSLIESLFILPVHMGHSLRAADRAKLRRGRSPLARVGERMDSGREALFNKIIIPRYSKVLVWSLSHRYITVAASLALLIVSIGMVGGGRVEFIFFETDDAETINATVNMPIGTAVGRTDAIISRIETIALEQPEIASIYAQSGAIDSMDGSVPGSASSHIGQLIFELSPVESRDRTSAEVIQGIQDELGEVPEAKSIRMEGVAGGPGGPALNFTISGEPGAPLDVAVARVKEVLSRFDGVYSISDDADSGKREVRFTLRDGASELGFTRSNLGRQIQGMVFGLEPFTFAGDREDVKVRVSTNDRVRRSLAQLEQQFVFTPDGRAVPLIEVAEITEAETDATIRRLDRNRSISVTAEVNREVANPDTVAAQASPQIAAALADLSGVRLVPRGRQKDMQDSFESLPIGMAVAAGLIYVVLAWLFGSFTQPLVVMLAIPFATIGMIWGHLILGYSMTFLSLIGFIALAGVVVNDSLIFMQFFNEERRKGLSVHDAGIAAGRARIRAILLTTVTTVLGLTPLMLEQSFQAKFLIPMAITIAFGLLSATGIILLTLPSLLMVLDDLAHVARIAWTGRVGAPRHNPFMPDPELDLLDHPERVSDASRS